MNNKNDLITKKPLKRNKGFLNENTNLDNFTKIDIDYIIKKIYFINNNKNLMENEINFQVNFVKKLLLIIINK